MMLTALCPTFRRPRMLANLVAMWQAQDYPIDACQLLILDDGGTFDDQQGENWRIYTHRTRFRSLPEKYNALRSLANRDALQTDVFLVMEDDDLYLPRYLSSHAAALKSAEYSKPTTVLSDYTGKLAEEQADGRFHASIGIRRELLERVGGWPVTDRADFDQQFMANLKRSARGIADPSAGFPPQYVFGWHTGSPHGQGFMKSPNDESWYERAGRAFSADHAGRLVPKLDDRTQALLNEAVEFRSRDARRAD